MSDETEPNTPAGKQTDPAQDSASAQAGPAPLFLQTLICPISRSALTYDRARGELISKAAGLAYPVREGVPIMLEDEARQLTDAEMT